MSNTPPYSYLLDLLGVRFIKSFAVAIAQSRTLNFSNGIQAAYNASTTEIDVTVTGAPQTQIEVTASRDLVAADIGSRLYSNSASAFVLTINKGLLLAGQRIDLSQMSTGQLSVAEGTNSTVRFHAGKGLKMDGAISNASLICDEVAATDLLTLVGEVVA